MQGDDVRTIREERGLNQTEFASWLNQQLNRKYDKQKVSRWENSSERIPLAVVGLLAESRRQGRPRGPALVLAVANQKGGVGKTVSAVNIATVLALQGYGVLFIDADPQANATLHFGINPYEPDAVSGRPRPTLFNALKTEASYDLDDLAIRVSELDIRVVPSSIQLAEIEPDLMVQSGGEHALKERLGTCRNRYDFVIIDTPPNIGQLTKNALTAADVIVIPCQTAIFSVVGIDFLLRNVNLTKRRSNPRLAILGILPTKFNRRLKNDVATLDDIHKGFGKHLRIFDPVPAAAIYDQTTASGRAAVEIDADAPGITAYEEVAAALVEERGKRLETVNVA